MLSFPVVFVSSARESDRNRINMAKGGGDFSIEESFLFRHLDLDGTLSNILAMKLPYPEEMTPCYKFRPSDDLLESSKKAASSYNREHK